MPENLTPVNPFVYPDLMEENPNPFFDPARISRAIFDPRKNFLKTIWQMKKPVLDSELNEREDIDNFIRRETLVLLAGYITIVEGICPEQSTLNNTLLFTAGEIVVRGWELTVQKNDGGFPSIDQNFSVVVIDTSSHPPVETVFPLNGLGFSPNISFDQPVGDNATTIIARGTFYNSQKRELCVELENTCSSGPVAYRVQTLDGFYSQTATIAAQSTHIFCLKEDFTNILNFPIGPSLGMGNRIDYAYLQVGEVEICSTVPTVKVNGHISNPYSVPSNIFDPTVGRETTRRTQIQFDIRTCAGKLPEPPEGFYIYPLFRVVRLPGQPCITLENVTTLVQKLDLRHGLFDLIVQGTGITHNKVIIGVNSDNTLVSGPPSAVVVGSTISVRNTGVITRNFQVVSTVYGPGNPLFNEEFSLAVGESACVNFDRQGEYNLNDLDSLSSNPITSISVIGWGGGGISAQILNEVECAIGIDYFPDSSDYHPCDVSNNPPKGSEQSLDIRVSSLYFDNFRLALCLATIPPNNGAYYDGFYLYVDSFGTLLNVDLSVTTTGAWNPMEHSFSV